MASEEQNITHEEMWDDSALVNSWNDALKEYKKYHSIHSKGGNVDDILNPTKAGESSDAKREGEGSTPDVKEDESEARMIADHAQDGVQEDHDDQGQHSHLPSAGSAFIPAPLLGSVRDESLKKLLMSWYYAGYYTGYYEGQQTQQQ
ncbi:hypothetical protein SUNI508_08653 [Seiridium unicorne]|uniref:Survival Motor Neuron Gemin2-binding domain-containing protein n=1 Tax=Seiridium unicorne TaxID=138068 RepID=A0ABR2US59_9PEZI